MVSALVVLSAIAVVCGGGGGALLHQHRRRMRDTLVPRHGRPVGSAERA